MEAEKNWYQARVERATPKKGGRVAAGKTQRSDMHFTPAWCPRVPPPVSSSPTASGGAVSPSKQPWFAAFCRWLAQSQPVDAEIAVPTVQDALDRYADEQGLVLSRKTKERLVRRVHLEMNLPLKVRSRSNSDDDFSDDDASARAAPHRDDVR